MNRAAPAGQGHPPPQRALNPDQNNAAAPQGDLLGFFQRTVHVSDHLSGVMKFSIAVLIGLSYRAPYTIGAAIGTSGLINCLLPEAFFSRTLEPFVPSPWNHATIIGGTLLTTSLFQIADIPTAHLVPIFTVAINEALRPEFSEALRPPAQLVTDQPKHNLKSEAQQKFEKQLPDDATVRKINMCIRAC